jgi:alpha/beta hydrolase fold
MVVDRTAESLREAVDVAGARFEVTGGEQQDEAVGGVGEHTGRAPVAGRRYVVGSLVEVHQVNGHGHAPDPPVEIGTAPDGPVRDVAQGAVGATGELPPGVLELTTQRPPCVVHADEPVDHRALGHPHVTSMADAATASPSRSWSVPCRGRRPITDHALAEPTATAATGATAIEPCPAGSVLASTPREEGSFVRQRSGDAGRVHPGSVAVPVRVPLVRVVPGAHALDRRVAGPTILFCHGNPRWSFLYRHIVLAHRDRFRCVAIDYLGFGLSDRPDDYDYTITEHAAVLGELVDGLALDDYVVMGQDWGGPIGTAVGVERADRVRGVVLGNT